MTNMQQKEIAEQIMEFATEMTEDNSAAPVTAEPKPEKVELLTVKECKELVSGLSIGAIRELAKQGSKI